MKQYLGGKMMKKTSGRLQIRKYLIMGLLGLGVVFSGGI